MSDIGNQIERGGEGPEWVERATNARLREEVDRLTKIADREYNLRAAIEIGRESLKEQLTDARSAARWLYAQSLVATDVDAKTRERWPWLAGAEGEA